MEGFCSDEKKGKSQLSNSCRQACPEGAGLFISHGGSGLVPGASNTGGSSRDHRRICSCISFWFNKNIYSRSGFLYVS